MSGYEIGALIIGAAAAILLVVVVVMIVQDWRNKQRAARLLG